MAAGSLILWIARCTTIIPIADVSLEAVEWTRASIRRVGNEELE